MSFLWRVAGLGVKDGVRSSDIQREFRAELLHPVVSQEDLESVAGTPC